MVELGTNIAMIAVVCMIIRCRWLPHPTESLQMRRTLFVTAITTIALFAPTTASAALAPKTGSIAPAPEAPASPAAGSASAKGPKPPSAPPLALVPTGLSCTNSSKTLMGYTSCSGAWEGNNKGGAVNVALTAAELFKFDGFITNPGSVSSNDEAPISPFPNDNANGLTTGTIFFSSLITGPVVLALKTNTAFSLFYYSVLPVNPGTLLSFVNFSTAGVSVGKNGNVQALSHATLYRGSVNPVPTPNDEPQPNIVPEPSTYALMATGMIGLAGITRRRRQA